MKAIEWYASPKNPLMWLTDKPWMEETKNVLFQKTYMFG